MDRMISRVASAVCRNILYDFFCPTLVPILVALAIVAGFHGKAFAQSVRPLALKKKLAVCTNTISKCGCAITKKGVYTLSADISSQDGETPDHDCIEIRASNVILKLCAHKITGPITGPGGTTSDIGIDIKHGSNNDTLLGSPATPAVVSGWGAAIYSNADSGVFSDIHADSNETAGFEFDGASDNRMTDWEAGNPEGTFGLWIRRGTNNFVTKGTASGNGQFGIFVGCADVASTAGEDCQGVRKSVGNDIVDNVVDSNTMYGIALDSDAAQTVVDAISGSTNGVHDLFDDSASCGSNIWTDDIGTTSDPCIQ